ncbi:glycosyltransferase family 39 protein [bacterium]|nr:glycosyltransferase family 39 protein [bacterium]
MSAEPAGGAGSGAAPPTLVDADRAPRALRVATVLLLGWLAIAGAWNHDLWTYDEPREAEMARSMWHSGTYAYPVLGERPFLEKPPLFSLSVAAAFSLTGKSVAAGRVVAALWASLALLAVAWFARRHLGLRAGLVAALVLATCWRYYAVAHTMFLDAALLGSTAWALVLGHTAARERRRALAVLAGLALGVAFLAKGLVGLGLVGTILALDVAWRRDREGAKTLLHPLALAGFVAPVVAYSIVLYRAGEPNGLAFLKEMFWDNQIGRFFRGYASKRAPWYLYFKIWPDMTAPWTFFSVVALWQAWKTSCSRDIQDASKRDLERFLLLWAVVPILLLTLSQGKGRSYLGPVVPAYALLIARWWKTDVSTGRLPAWGYVLLGVLAFGGAIGVLGFVAWRVAFLGLSWPHAADSLEVLGALVAAGAALALVALPAERRRSSESGALLAGLIAVGAYFVFSSAPVANQFERTRSYRPLAEDAWMRAGERRLLLFHCNDSWSGTFAFYADRSTPEFSEAWDPHGERLLAVLGPASKDVVFAPLGAIRKIDGASRGDLVIEWTGVRECERQDGDDPFKKFAMFRRRKPDEPPRDPVPERAP